MEHFKGECPKMFRIMISKCEVPFRATEDHGFGPGSLNHLQIPSGQFKEGGLISTPQGIVSATAFVVADNRLHTHPVEQGEHTSSTLEGRQIQVPEDHIKVGQAPYKVKIISSLPENPHLLCP
jgi:hypothetical protein